MPSDLHAVASQVDVGGPLDWANVMVNFGRLLGFQIAGALGWSRD